MIHDDMYKYLKGPLIGNLTWYCGDEDYGIGETRIVSSSGLRVCMPCCSCSSKDFLHLECCSRCEIAEVAAHRLQRRHKLHPECSTRRRCCMDGRHNGRLGAHLAIFVLHTAYD